MKLEKALENYLQKRFEIRLAGIGGQGLIMGGLIIADAVGIYENKYSIQTERYAPLARGAPSRSEVIISNEPIDYPKVLMADLQVFLSPDSYKNYKKDTKTNGLIIADSINVKEEEVKPNAIFMPLTDVSLEVTGKQIAVCIVALGAITAFTDVVKFESLQKSVGKFVPKGTHEINLKALLAGREFGLEYHKKLKVYLKSGLN